MEEEKQTFKSEKDPKDFKDSKDSKKFRGKRGKKGFKPNKQQAPAHNDFGWLNHADELIKIAGSLPMSRFAGEDIVLSKSITTAGVEYPDETSIPGIMTIRCHLTAGTALDGNSAFNYAVRVLWTKLRSATSGTIPVSTNDLAIYVLALGQLLGGLGYVDRLLNTIGAFKPLNRYTPMKLVESMGCDYSDIVDNYSNLLFRSAYWKSCLKALVFPDMDYFKNCYYIFSKVYTDSQSSEQSQYYLFTPYALGKYNSVGSEQGATLEYTVMENWDDGSASSAADVISAIDELFNAIMNDDLINNVSGFLKRMESQGIMHTTSYDSILAMGSTEYAIYDPEILLQIHNARCFPCDTLKMLPVLGSANDFSYYTTTYNISGTQETVRLPELFVDPLVTNPSTEVIVMSSRLVPTINVTHPQDDTWYELHSWDIIIPHDFRINSGTHGNAASFSISEDNMRVITVSATVVNYLPFTQFDFCPIFVAYNSLVDRALLLGDVYNLQPVAKDALSNLHTAKLISLFSTK